MSVSLGRIVAEITANTAGLRRGAADAQRILNDTSNNASAAGKAIGIAFAVTAALGVMKLIDKLEDCTQVAIDNKKALMGLESVAKAYGVSVEDATKATKDFTQDGLLQMKSATTGMKNILSTGFNVSEAMKLAQAMKDIGAFNNVTGDLGQAFEDATKGMRTGSIELIENIGLTQKLSAVMKAANIDVSNGIDLTNNAAQREAFYNMVLKEGEKFKGNAAKLADDQASSQAKANAAMQEAADAIGNRLLPAYSGLMDVITKVSKATSEYIKGSELDKVTSSYYKQREELKYLSEAYFKLKGNLNKTTTEQEMYLDVINKLKMIQPDILKNIDMENISNATALNLLQQINSNLETKYLLMAKEAAMNDNMEKAAKYRDAERKQLERINKLETDRKQGKTPNFGGVIFYGGYEGAIKNAKTLAKLYKKTADDALEAATKAGEYWQLQIDRVSNKNVSFKEPDWLVKMKQDVKKRQEEEAAKKKAEEEAAAAGKKSKKETFSLDTSETTKQKLIEQEYKYKTDLANAKEEGKWRVELENEKAVAIIKATAEAEKKIAAIRKKVEKGELLESAGRNQAVAINEQLAKDIGQLEVDTALKINYHIDENAAQESAQNAADFYAEEYEKRIKSKLDEAQKAADFYAKKFEEQYKGSDLEKLMDHFNNPQFEEVDGTYVKKTLDDVTKSFSELAAVLDNEVISAISNIANQAMSMSSNIKGFSAAKGAGDKLGMLSSGIGVFSSAVSIFSMVGGLFSKSTYNFDEAVKKMLAGIGEKTPNIQVAEYQKGIDLKKYLEEQGIAAKRYSQITKEQKDYLSSMGIKTIETITVDSGSSNSTGAIKTTYTLGKTAIELLGALDKIVPQLAEQLGTAAGDFGSAIGSALSSATTSEELKANLYDSIYGTVKSGLINAFLAGEVMKPLLENLQQTVTLAVADGTLDAAEKTAIQGLLGEVNTEADKFYFALEEVGLNVVDAAGQLNEAADRMDNVNRNLRLADRISTMTSTAAVTQLAGNSSIVYDFSNANLGGMTEQQVISAVSKANRMASIRKVGV